MTDQTTDEDLNFCVAEDGDVLCIIPPNPRLTATPFVLRLDGDQATLLQTDVVIARSSGIGPAWKSAIAQAPKVIVAEFDDEAPTTVHEEVLVLVTD